MLTGDLSSGGGIVKRLGKGQRHADLVPNRLGKHETIVEGQIAALGQHHQRAERVVFVLQRHDHGHLQSALFHPLAHVRVGGIAADDHGVAFADKAPQEFAVGDEPVFAGDALDVADHYRPEGAVVVRQAQRSERHAAGVTTGRQNFP